MRHSFRSNARLLLQRHGPSLLAPIHSPLTSRSAPLSVSLLQVAPQHAALSASSGGPIQDSKDNQNLSALELQSKGAVRHAVTSRKGLVPYNKNKVNQGKTHNRTHRYSNWLDRIRTGADPVL